jgi:hypothetical protein
MAFLRTGLIPLVAATTLLGLDDDFVRPIRLRPSKPVDQGPTLHPTKGYRGVKKKHRSKFKRRGRKS